MKRQWVKMTANFEKLKKGQKYCLPDDLVDILLGYGVAVVLILPGDRSGVGPKEFKQTEKKNHGQD